MEQTKQKRQPIITLRSFLISFAIIAGVFLVVSLFTDSDNSSKMPSRALGEEYEYTVVEGEENSNNSILAIPVTGVILTEATGGLGFFDFLGEEGITYGYDVKEQLKRAAEDDSIKAVLLEVNSPGGTVGGSKAISDGIEYYKKATGNPVYTHITDVGASGGYWAASSTDFIVSEVGSTVGSIGVIMGPFKYYDGVQSELNVFDGVETENGVEYRYFTGGQYKDTGSPYRRLTEEEVTHWQTAINNEYNLFVSHVSAARNLNPEFIRNTVKALPYETTRALELGLIDAVGSRDETIVELRNAAGIQEDDYNVIKEESIGDFFSSIFALMEQPKAESKQAGCSWCGKPMFLYDSSYTLLR